MRSRLTLLLAAGLLGAAAALTGCCSLGGGRRQFRLDPGCLYHDYRGPLAADGSPTIDPLARRVPAACDQWRQIDLTESQPCVKACRRTGGPPVPPGCFATCEALAGRAQATAAERCEAPAPSEPPAQQKAPPSKAPGTKAWVVTPSSPPPGGVGAPSGAPGMRPRWAAILLWLRSRETYAAVKEGGGR